MVAAASTLLARFAAVTRVSFVRDSDTAWLITANTPVGQDSEQDQSDQDLDHGEAIVPANAPATLHMHPRPADFRLLSRASSARGEAD